MPRLPAFAAVLSAMAVLLLGACSFNSVQGSVAASETRSVGTFDGVKATGIANVHVVVGPSHSVIVHADDNLLAHVETVLDGSDLVVRTTGSISTKQPLKIDVTLPSLIHIGASGTADVVAEGIDSQELTVKVSGTGDVQAAGSAKKLVVRCSGTGDAMLAGLEVVDAEATVSGTGDVDVTVSGVLDATASGTGDVTYGGSPTEVKKSTSGTGDVEPRDAE